MHLQSKVLRCVKSPRFFLSDKKVQNAFPINVREKFMI